MASSPCCRIIYLSACTVVFCFRLEGVTDESVECVEVSSCSSSDYSSDDQGMEDLDFEDELTSDSDYEPDSEEEEQPWSDR